MRSQTDMTRSMWCSTKQHGHARRQRVGCGVPERVHLAFGQAAGRLVEQEQARLGHEGPGQRSPSSGSRRAARPGGAGRTRPPRARRAPRARGRRHDALRGSTARCPGRTTPGRSCSHWLRPEHDVLVHGQPGAEPDALQRARDAELCQIVRPVPAQDGAAVGDGSAACVDEPADDVEERGLAGAVGPDDADDLARRGPPSRRRRGRAVPRSRS